VATQRVGEKWNISRKKNFKGETRAKRKRGGAVENVCRTNTGRRNSNLLSRRWSRVREKTKGSFQTEENPWLEVESFRNQNRHSSEKKGNSRAKEGSVKKQRSICMKTKQGGKSQIWGTVPYMNGKRRIRRRRKGEKGRIILS